MNLNDVLRYGVGAILVMAAGCTHYYQVSDPAGTKMYYTTGIDKTDAGAIRIKDEKTGADVTLQSSEVKEISEMNTKRRSRASQQNRDIDPRQTV
jgi:hypothetical protein